MAGTPTATLTYKTQDQFVGDMTTDWAAQTGQTPVLLPGDPALAIFQSQAVQDVFLQFLIQAVLAAARLSTATGADVDTFVADYGLTREAATLAQGPVTLTALTAPSSQVLIPAGTVVQTTGGAIQYQLIADTTQAAWSATLNAYVLQAGQTSITATAQALLAGSAYNVQAGQIDELVSAVPGVDTVTNAASITNGLDQETDAALRVRFVEYLISLFKATEDAILFAVNSVQQGLDVLALENINVALNPQNGVVTVIIDDGSGNPPSSLIAAVQAAVNGVRAFAIPITVIGPAVKNVSIALNIRIAGNPTETSGVIKQNVQNAVLNYVNALTLGRTLYLNKLAEVAIDADANVVSVQPGSITITPAGGSPINNADYPAPTQATLIRTTLTSITIGTY